MSNTVNVCGENGVPAKVEMVVLEINFGKGRKDDILVYFGDDPKVLAEQFVMKHSLKESAVAAVRATIEQTIADFKRESDPSSYFDPPVSTPPQSATPPVASPERKHENNQNNNEFAVDEDRVVIPHESEVEVYKGQPPVELQADGLPEPSSRSEAMEENIRIINGHVIEFPTADHAASAASTRYGSIISYDSRDDPTHRELKEEKSDEEFLSGYNATQEPSSIMKAFTSPRESQNFSDDYYVLSKSGSMSCSGGGHDERFTLSDFRPPVRALSANAALSPNSSSSKSFGVSISDKIAASKMHHKAAPSGSQGQDRASLPLSSAESESKELHPEMSVDEIYSGNDAVIIGIQSDLSVRSNVDEIPSRDVSESHTPYNESGLSSPHSEPNTMIGRTDTKETQKRLPKLYYKPTVPGHVSASTGTSPKSTSPRRPVSERLFDYFGSNLSSKEMTLIEHVEEATSTENSPATTADVVTVNSSDPSTTQQQQLVAQELNEEQKVQKIPSNETLFRYISTENSNKSLVLSHEAEGSSNSFRVYSQPGSENASPIVSIRNIPEDERGDRGESPRSASHSPIMRGGGRKSGIDSPAAPATPLTAVMREEDREREGGRDESPPGSVRSVTPLTLPAPVSAVSTYHNVGEVSPLEPETEPPVHAISPRYEDYTDPSATEKPSRNQNQMQKQRDTGGGDTDRGDVEDRERSPRAKPTTASTEEERRFYTLKSLGGRNESLLPSASVLALNKEFRPESHLTGGNTRKLTPNSRKSVSDRLHDSANKSRIQREKRIVEAEEERVQQRAASQYTVSGVSKGMAGSKINSDICSRLYADGVRGLEKKKKRARDSRVEWSCSRCGKFQVQVGSSVGGVYNTDDRNAEQLNDQDQVCGNCGYNQRASTPFRPTNHSQSIDGTGGGYRSNAYYNNEDSQLSYYTSNKATVFDFLYADKQHETVMNRAIRMNERNTATDFTFKPVISEGSNMLLQRRVEQIRERELYPDRDFYSEDMPVSFSRDGEEYSSPRSYQGSRIRNQSPGGNSRRGRSPIGHKTNNNNGSVACSSSFAPPTKSAMSDRKRASSAPSVRNLAHYLTLPAAERLNYNRGSPPKNISSHRSVVRSEDEYEDDYNRYSGTQSPGSKYKKVQMSSEKFQGLVDRLAYEYKVKDKRRAKAIAEATTTDPRTGVKYFHPVLPPRPAGSPTRRPDTTQSAEWRGSKPVERNGERGEGYEGNYYPVGGPRDKQLPPKGTKRKPQEVYRDMIRKDDERQERVRQAQLQAENLIDGQLARSKKLALPMSDTILKESNERHLKELFTHLLATTPSHTHDSNRHSRSSSIPSVARSDDPENINSNHIFDFDCGSEHSNPDFNNLSAISSPGLVSLYKFTSRPYGSQSVTSQNIETKRLDLGLVNLTNLAPEVAALVNQVRDERTRRTPVKGKDRGEGEGDLSLRLPSDMSYSNTESLSRTPSSSVAASKNVPVDFKEFSQLVARCLQRKEGQPGRSYLYLPNRAPETSMKAMMVEMEREKDKGEYTFHPSIDQVSVALSLARENKQHTPKGKRGEITPRLERDRELTPRSEKDGDRDRDRQHTPRSHKDGERDRDVELTPRSVDKGSPSSASQSERNKAGRSSIASIPTMKEFMNDDSLSRSFVRGSSDNERSVGGGRSGSASSLGGRSDKSAPRRNTPIEDILREEGLRTSSRIEAARKDFLRSEQESHPFKPTLFKPPRHLVPRYKGEKLVPPPPPDMDHEEFLFSARIKELEATDKSVSTEFSKISMSVKQFDGVQEKAEVEGSVESKGERRRSSRDQVTRTSLSDFYNSAYHGSHDSRHDDGASSHSQITQKEMNQPYRHQPDPIYNNNPPEERAIVDDTSELDPDTSSIKNQSEEDKNSSEVYIMCTDSPTRLSRFSTSPSIATCGTSPIVLNIHTRLNRSQCSEAESALNSNRSSINGSFTLTNVSHEPVPRSDRGSEGYPLERSSSRARPVWDANKKIVYDDDNVTGPAYRTVAPRLKARARPPATKPGGGSQTSSREGFQYLQSFSDEAPMGDREVSVDRSRVNQSVGDRSEGRDRVGDSSGKVENRRRAGPSGQTGYYAASVSRSSHSGSFVPPPLPLEIQRRRQSERQEMH